MYTRFTAKSLLSYVVLLILALTLAACDSTNVPSSAPTVTISLSDESGVASAEATAAALVTAGASTGSGDTAPAGIDLATFDPCSLLTADEITSAMGDVPVAPRQMSASVDHTACSYVEPTLEVNSPRLFLSLDPTDYWDLYNVSTEPVSGLGDGAFLKDFNGWQSLYALAKNKAIVSLDFYPKDVEVAKQLLQKALDRLPK